MRRKVAARGLVDAITIASAGTHAYHVGHPPDNRSQAHALQRGYDMSAQRAQRVKAADFETFDHLLAMDKDNLAWLQQQCPLQHKHKLALLMRYSKKYPQQAEVPDPYDGGAAGFEAVLDYIEDACDELIAAIHAQK
jgi:protein-tyrosine phosphatase